MATISKFSIGDLATYNYRLSDSEPPLLWSCVVTKVNAGKTYDVRFDGIQVPEGNVPGCPGPQETDVIRAYESQLQPRAPKEDDALKAASWAYKVKAWTSAQAAALAARDAAWHMDMCARFGHIVTSRDRIPVSWTYNVEQGLNWARVTEKGFLISTDPKTFLGTVEFSGGKTKAVRIQDLVF